MKKLITRTLAIASMIGAFVFSNNASANTFAKESETSSSAFEKGFILKHANQIFNNAIEKFNSHTSHSSHYSHSSHRSHYSHYSSK